MAKKIFRNLVEDKGKVGKTGNPEVGKGGRIAFPRDKALLTQID